MRYEDWKWVYFQRKEISMDVVEIRSAVGFLFRWLIGAQDMLVWT